MVAERRNEDIVLSNMFTPWHYEKRLSLRGNRLHAQWRIRNAGSVPQAFVWICHCLWRLEPDMRFCYPPGVSAVLVDSEIPTPLITTTVAEGEQRKIYLQQPVAEGLCGFDWLGAGISVRLRFDRLRLPWLGFWITNGGWFGARHFGFEPTTGYYDTVRRACASGTAVTLKPGENTEFSLEIIVSLLSRRIEP